MRLRSLAVAVLTAVALVPVTGSVASAAETTPSPTVSGVTKTYKTSAVQRAKRAARTTVAAPTVAVPVASSTTVSYADRVLALTNAERSARGLRPLALSPCADGFADAWAVKLAATGALSHQAMSPIMTTCRASRAGENVAYGNVTPEGMVKMWMDSAGHRANILNAGYTHLGVGTTTTSSGTYGVQVFVTL